MSSKEIFEISDVIKNDCCIGCGSCAVKDRTRATVKLQGPGLYQAEILPGAESELSEVCPFSNRALDEDSLADIFLPDNPHRSAEIGVYRSLYAGRVSSDEFRIDSSSGGLVSWVAIELLQQGAVDGIIHVKSRESKSGPLFEFGVSHTVEEVLDNRKSIYYPVEFSNAIESARANGGRYAFIGIPCHVKAVRLLQLKDQWAREHIRFTLGLVCGHMKATGFGESLAWQLGVTPTNLLEVDFRVKDKHSPANRYRFAATSADDHTRRESANSELVGANWGHGFFQPNACNYCDDIFAETADICFGDAWLPRFQNDPLGHNVVVVRSASLDDLLRQGAETGSVLLEKLSENEVYATQAGNFRHRQLGLAVRLADDDLLGLPHPHKRTLPSYSSVDSKRIEMVRLRREMSARSLIAFEEAKTNFNLKIFFRRMNSTVRKYDRIVARTSSRKILSAVPLMHQRKVRQTAAALKGMKPNRRR